MEIDATAVKGARAGDPRVSRLLALCLALAAGCSGGDNPVDPDPGPGTPPPIICPAPIIVSQSLTTPTTWSPGIAGCRHYRVVGEITVWDPLTIQPGTVVTFGREARINVRSSGSLSAIGTAALSIKFIGDESVRGHWHGLYFSSNSSANELSFVEVAHAGGSGGANAADVTVEAFSRLRLTNSTLRESSGSGLYAGHSASLAGFSTNRLQNNLRAGVRIPDDLLGSLDVGSDYTTGNGQNYLDVYADDIDSPQTWRVTSAPIRFTGSTVIWSPLSIAPGMTIVFGPDARWSVRGSGSLSAVGTSASPIRLLGEQPVRGYWQGVYFTSSSSANELTFVEIAHAGGVGGGNAANVTAEAFSMLRVTNTTLRESSGSGLYVGHAAKLPGFSTNTLRNNAATGIRLPDDLLGSLDVASNYATGNGKTYLDVYGDDVNTPQTWRVTSAPIRFTGSTTIWAALSISPGMTFSLGPNVRWEVRGSGSLTAIGSAASMIRFVGEQAVRGYWDGLYFGSNSASNELTFVEVAHAGGVGGTVAANVTVNAFDRLRLTNSLLREGAGWGLYVDPRGVISPVPVAGAGNSMTNNTRGGSNVP